MGEADTHTQTHSHTHTAHKDTHYACLTVPQCAEIFMSVDLNLLSTRDAQ